MIIELSGDEVAALLAINIIAQASVRKDSKRLTLGAVSLIALHEEANTAISKLTTALQLSIGETPDPALVDL